MATIIVHICILFTRLSVSETYPGPAAFSPPLPREIILPPDFKNLLYTDNLDFFFISSSGSYWAPIFLNSKCPLDISIGTFYKHIKCMKAQNEHIMPESTRWDDQNQVQLSLGSASKGQDIHPVLYLCLRMSLHELNSKNTQKNI